MKKAIIHIGGHKTGTTAIQAFCVSNSIRLQQKDIIYPLELLTDINSQGLQAHHGLVNLFMDNTTFWKFVDLRPEIPDIKSYLQTLPRDKNILLSSENLVWLDAESINTLKELLNGYEVHVILYVRRQDDALQALYQTSVVYHNESRQFDEYVKDARLIFEYDKIAESWQSAFGEGKVIVRVYEKEQLYDKNSVMDFIQVLKHILQISIDVADWDIGSAANIINRGVPAHITSLIRYYNSLGHGKNKIVPTIKKIANRIYKDSQSSYETILPSQRRNLLLSFAESNERLARKFLHREDGVLFKDLTIQQSDNEWNNKYNWNGSYLNILLCDVISQLNNQTETKK